MSALEIRSADTGAIKLESIKRDEALSCRARGVNARTIAEYSAAMKAGTVFPAVVVFRDPRGVHWLADGFHRTAAADLAGIDEIAADVREGGRREALLFAASANGAHGLRRTNADKRRAVELVLASFPRWSDRKVGEACGVDNKTVARARGATEEIPQSAEREGSDGKVRRSRKVKPSAANAAKSARRELDRLARRWPKGEPVAALVGVAQEWIACLEVNTSLPSGQAAGPGEASPSAGA